MSLRPPKPDCYDYVRRYYGVPAYIGVRVRVRGKEGVLVDAKSSQQYVHIQLDGEKHAHPYHPTDGIEYLAPLEHVSKSLLTVMGKGQGYLKAGFLGFNKSGKTWTAALLAIGTRQFFGLEGPIAMYDTEGGSEYIAPLVRRSTGKDLIGVRSRSLADLIAMAKECERSGVSVLLADSMTHPWREVCKSYLDEVNRRRTSRGKQPRQKLEFQDWGQIKELWSPWTDFFLNSKLHIIVCGRAGYDYDYEMNDETNQRELIKTGVKMKTEGEFGFEPSLLVEMERVQDMSGDYPKILHRAVVIGERFGVIDGKMADNPTFEFFKPHLEQLKPGAYAPIDTESRTVVAADDAGDADWNSEKRERTILCEEIQGVMVKRWPGQSADEKAAKLALLEEIFETRSWTKVENLNSSTLRAGLNQIRAILQPNKESGELFASQVIGAPAEPKRSRKRKEPSEFIAPRELRVIEVLSSDRGWTHAELVAALQKKHIESPERIPANRFEEICALIESGTELEQPSETKVETAQ